MTINIVEKIDDRVPVNTVLVSVSDKKGLAEFVPRMLEINPALRILSTGGTYNRIKELLGDAADRNLISVSEYTGQPETQGGLVKTLDFKIYLGLLTETYNSEHQKDLERTAAQCIDMVVVNLYPFEETIAKAGVTVESARGNIDIGGPCMLRASAKNFLRVAPVADPADYDSIVKEMTATGGKTTLALRYALARKAFAHTAAYDRAIADYLASKTIEADVRPCYRMER